jgi:hypothetical protein
VTGVLSGTPTVNGTFNFTVTAKGFGNCTQARAYTLMIGGGGGCPTITLSASLPNGTVGQVYSNAMNASPSDSYNYTSTGSLPPGVILYGPFGLLYGYPTMPGTYTFTITATAGACSGSQQYTVTIGSNAPAMMRVVNDFDGDGKSDLSVFRGTDSTWLIALSGDGRVESTKWEMSEVDLTVAGDYDGDGKTDQAVYRRGDGETGNWYIKRSSDRQVSQYNWGAETDLPVPADYDGDGKTDVAVWRGAEGNRYIIESRNATLQIVTWGDAAQGDVPVPGDYNGDGKADITFWRASSGSWEIKLSGDQAVMAKTHGQRGDVPILTRKN